MAGALRRAALAGALVAGALAGALRALAGALRVVRGAHCWFPFQCAGRVSRRGKGPYAGLANVRSE